MIYFLKINTDTKYAYRNFQLWINNIFTKDNNPLIVTVCDNDLIADKLEKNIEWHDTKHELIQSYRKETKNIISKIANKKWENAGFAHLTPFYYSKNNGLPEFWNIDADDTLMCVDDVSAARVMEQIENEAKKNKIDIFSLDMWRSRSKGKHWSFGITYVSGGVDWIEKIKECTYEGINIEFSDRVRPKNIDEFFTYIKNHDASVNIGSFYVKNLMFVHYSEDFLYNPIQSSVYKYGDGVIEYPLLLSIFNVKTMGKIPVYGDVNPIDIDIHMSDCEYFLAKISNYTEEAENLLESEEYISKFEEIVIRNIDKIYNQILNDYRMDEIEIYIFGLGKFAKLTEKIMYKKGIEVLGILDNDPNKQGTKYKTVDVLSPLKLTESDEKKKIVLVCIKQFSAVSNQIKEINKETELFNIFNFRREGSWR